MKDLILFFVGIGVGGMNAVAGGGMLLGFPVLLAAGLPALAANVTSNIVVLPGSLSSAYGYRAYIRKVPRRYLLLVIPCMIGAATGALILRNTPTSRFQHLVPALVLFAVFLFIAQPFLHFHLHRHMHTPKRKKLSPWPLVIISVALLPVAVYGGYFGAGFGFIMLAFLGFTSLHDAHQMNGLKNLAGATISIVSIICLFSTHLINWHYGLVMAAGGLIGGYYGALLTQKIPSHVDEGMMIDRMVHERDYSEDTAKVIDQEVEALISEAANRARFVIKANMGKLEELKDRLLEKETVDADEVDEVLKDAKLPPAAALY